MAKRKIKTVEQIVTPIVEQTVKQVEEVQSITEVKLDHPGELIPYERRYLFDKVMKHQPRIVVEIGTGSCGSSICILEALKQIGSGTLYTCDPYNIDGKKLKEEYGNRVEFLQVDGTEFINQLQSAGILVDFIFCDGPEEPDQILNYFLDLQSITSPNCVFIAHDWEYNLQRIDGNISIKSRDLRQYLESCKDWKILEVLSGLHGQYPNDSGYNSVGMVYAVKVNNANSNSCKLETTKLSTEQPNKPENMESESTDKDDMPYSATNPE